MTLRVQLPEDIAHRLEACWSDMPRRALEAIAVEGYRSGALTRAEVGRMLEFSFWEAEAFLKERQAYLPYDEADLDQDLKTLDQIQSD